MSAEIRPLSECDVIIPGAAIAYWWDYKVHLARYVFAAEFVKGKDVLDIGCGVGYGSSYLLRKGAKTVTGVEISSEAVELAKAHYERAGLEFLNLDATSLPFVDNSFDVVTSIGMIDHVDDPDRVLAELHRVLRHGGHFLCSIVNKEFINVPLFEKRLDPFHKIEFNPAELSHLCSKYFSDVQLHGQKTSKLWYLICSLSSVVSRKSMIFHHITQNVGRAVFRNKLKPLVYSEDRVDTDFASGSEYVPFTLEQQSRFGPFIVVGSKDSP